MAITECGEGEHDAVLIALNYKPMIAKLVIGDLKTSGAWNYTHRVVQNVTRVTCASEH
jgi:hypothetical protein